MDKQLENFKAILKNDYGTLSWEGDGYAGYKTIYREDGPSSRWTQTIEIVTQFPDGRLFEWGYDQGLTEYQDDEFPWEYSDWNPVEVEPYEVTITRYRKIQK